MTRLLGFEGGSTSVAGWGAAAVETGDGVYNTVSRRATTLAEFRELAEADAVTELAAVDVPEDVLNHPSVLLRIRKDTQIPDRALLTRESFHSWSDGNDCYWLFRSAAALQRTLSRVVDQLTRGVLQRGALPEYLELASALSPRHPEMNAIWADSKGTPVAEHMAASIVDPTSAQRFTQMLEALRTSGHVTLVYDGGSATGHRLASHAMADLSTALERAFGLAASRAAQCHPFLEQIPRPDVEERRAASVDWTLRLSDENRYAAVAKAMVWQQMREILTSEEDAQELLPLLSPDTGVHLERVLIGERAELTPIRVARREVTWEKTVSASEVQKQRVGSSMPYLRLTHGSLSPEDYADVEGGWTSYFRSVLFADLEWTYKSDGSGERASITMPVRFPGYLLPHVVFELDHKEARVHHSEPKTFLRWPPQILDILRRGYYVGYVASLAAVADGFELEFRPGQVE